MSTRTIIRTVITPRAITRRVGPAGAGGGATTFAALTDKATADLPAINAPLASALAAKEAAGAAAAAQAFAIQRGNHTGTQAHTTITGLGTLATQNGTFSGTSSGTNTGDQTNITGNAGTVSSIGDLTGVVTSTNRATSIADAALSIAKTSGLQTALDNKLDDSEASTSAIADTLARRDGSGAGAFKGLSTSGPVTLGYSSPSDALTFNHQNYAYGYMAATYHRIALGATTVGDAVFTAASIAAANQALGMVSGTAKGVTAAASTTTNVISLSIPSAGLWRIEALSTWINASSSSTLMSLLLDSNTVVPATNFRIGQTMVNASVSALTVVSPSLVAVIGSTLATASVYINSTAFGLIETTGASTLILRVQNTAALGTSTVTQASLSATHGSPQNGSGVKA